MKRTLFIVLALSLLSGCADGFKGYFKKSANNKLIDSKGFEGSKRRPLYNKKYIALAKKRVADDNIDEDLDDSDADNPIENIPNSSKLNRQMYLEMVKSDSNKSRFKKYKEQYNVNDSLEDDSYPSLPAANNKAVFNKSDDNILRKELEEIKSMLNDTRRELTKHKCPIQKPTDNNSKKPLLKEKFTAPDLQEELKKLPPPSSI